MNQNDVASVLGVDPAPPSPAPEVPKPEPPKQQDTDDTKVSLTRDEFDALVERAKNYDTISNDPRASAMLRDYYQKALVNSQVGTPQEQPQSSDINSPEDPSVDLTSRLAKLEQQYNEGFKTVQQMAHLLGSHLLQNFSREHPDFGRYQDEIAAVMQQAPGLQIADAYTLVKARHGHSEQSADKVQAGTVAQPAEGRTTTGAPTEVGVDDVWSEASARINDRKATPSTDAAFDAALKAAQKMHEME